MPENEVFETFKTSLYQYLDKVSESADEKLSGRPTDIGIITTE